LFALAGAFVGGAMLAIQAPTNAFLAKAAGSPVNAALVSFVVGAAGLLIAAVALGARPSVAAAREMPWYAWTGGIYGAIFVAVAAFAAPRMGVTFFLTVAIAGQLLTALLLDRFGVLGLPRVDFSPARLAGVALVLGGVLLVRK
jgi:transporter family-2 protein